MTEAIASPNVSLADIYNSILACQTPPGRTGQRVKLPLIDDAEVERQCREIDELWCELGNCILKWRGYPVEFIATRFANMHYVGTINKIDSAKPPEEVWSYLVEKISQQVYGKLVVMRHREYTPGRVFAWK